MRLRTKLVLLVTGLVFLLVAATSWLYLTRSLQQFVDQNYVSTDVIAHQVSFAVKQAVEQGVIRDQIDPTLPAAGFEAQIGDALRTNPAMNALTDSILFYAPTVFDVSVTDSVGMVLLSTDPTAGGKPLPWRPEYGSLRFRSPMKVLQIIFGKPRVYDLAVTLERNSRPFATVHIGVRTSFLREAFRPTLSLAFGYALGALLISLLAAAIVASIALAPIEQISRRLDVLNAESADAKPTRKTDALVQVSSKIERIGERMRNTEEIFSTLKQNLDQILSNLQDGMMLFTRGNRALLISSSVERFLNKSRVSMLGADVTDIFDRQTRLGRMVLDAFASRTSIPQTEVLTETNHHLEISLEIVQDERESLGALLTLHDLESVREIESELELSRRLSAIGRLTGGVGHEVKNPINAIVVHLELLRNKVAANNAPALRHLTVIESEIKRLDRVVETLVNFSRPMELQREDEDLREITEAVLELASAELTRKQVQLEVRLPEKAVVVKVDADMLRQAILNIVLNGAQAMTEGGALRIHLSEESRHAVLSIADTGVGIAQEVLPRIFDLYFTTKKDGSGIGLAMCYRIVQLHSGVIDVQSEPGRGTTFVLKIPLSHAMERESRGRYEGQPAPSAAL